MAAKKSFSLVGWVMSTNSASSPLPFWIMLAMETPCSPNTEAMLGQHARHVLHVHLDEERRLHLLGRVEAQLAVARAALQEAHVLGVGDGHDVAHHRGGGRQPAGARAHQHDLADLVALQEHRVVGAVDGGQRMIHRHQGREHPHAHPAVDQPGRTDELDDETEVLGVPDVVQSDVLDALVGHVARA